ncbi:MAG: hypothetical protein HOK62_10255, partial [Verrucomicrobiales bacterium]|nr:hypothetical protein [Verrucomicrobiales bacterium]
GQAQYVSASDAKEFKAVKGVTVKTGFIVIQPGTFGLEGSVIREISANAKAGELKKQLANALGQHKPNTLSYYEHRAAGVRAGKRWESKTPSTDNSSPRERVGRQRR